MLYRIEKHHKSNCVCVTECGPPADWYWPKDGFEGQPNIVRRDAVGTKRDSTHRWARMVCAAGCPAVLLVNLTELERAISSTVRKERKSK